MVDSAGAGRPQQSDQGPDQGPGQGPEQDEFDVVVIGTGSAGKPLAGELAKAGRSVLAIERELVGGECAYLACIPSKAMLLAAGSYRSRVRGRRSGDVRPDQTDRAEYARAVAVRDRTTRYRDDGNELQAMEKDGVTVLRGSAVVTAEREVTITAADGRTRTARWRQALVLATGAEAVVPPIDGLADAPIWTSSAALSGEELPDRLAILGGGAIGCELAQVYASFGSRVTLIEASPTLLSHESGWLGEALAGVLHRDGVEVRTSTKVTAVEPVDGSAGTAGTAGTARILVEDGDPILADRILVAVGKRPRTTGFGLATLGITAQADGSLPVDARCRVITDAGPRADVFAIGDVTALAPYTHTANYHARLVAAELLGHGRDADHVGIPRVIYTDPAVFCTGETEQAALERGADVLSARYDATGTSRSAIERTADHDDHRPARLELVADAGTGVLIGVSAIGPDADSWAAELALAVRARITVHTLADALHAFPSWTEAIHPPARELAEQIPRGH